jgi:hypothetical protein
MSKLRTLSPRLLALHKTLLDDETRAYQAAHGRAPSGGELFRLVLDDAAFAWLRPLSGLIARIDEAAEETPEGPTAAAERTLVAEVRDLLRSQGEGPFQTKYRDALQRSPDVVMAHAAVIRIVTAP